jgi:hypothetical protein
MPRRGKNGTLEPSDAEVRAILVSAMAEVGADPALIYAFQRTGAYVCEENERRLSRSQLAAWNGVVDEYYETLAGTRPRVYGCRESADWWSAGECFILLEDAY